MLFPTLILLSHLLEQGAATPAIAPSTEIVTSTEHLDIQGFKQLQRAYTGYTARTRSSLLPSAAGLSPLFPRFGFVPPAPRGLVWSTGVGLNQGVAATWFCLSGTATTERSQALVYATRAYAPGTYFYNTTCGATGAVVPTGAGVPLAATYWPVSAARQTVAASAAPGHPSATESRHGRASADGARPSSLSRAGDHLAPNHPDSAIFGVS